jgi:hypothetical protein
MLLLNVCTVTGNKKTVQVGLCFLSREKEAAYAWAMTAFREEVLVKHNIGDPSTFVTDRELACMKYLDKLFPNSVYILCIWHVNINILANCRKLFPKDQEVVKKVIPDPKWQEFLKDWNCTVDSTTEAEYTSHLTQFRKYNYTAVSYIEETWLQL